jgi:hypothetical protein
VKLPHKDELSATEENLTLGSAAACLAMSHILGSDFQFRRSVLMFASALGRELERLKALQAAVDELSDPARDGPSAATKRKLRRTVRQFYQGLCPLCRGKQIVAITLAPPPHCGHDDHWVSRSDNRITSLWHICDECNLRLGAANSPARREPRVQVAFDSFQECLALLDKAQGRLI